VRRIALLLPAILSLFGSAFAQSGVDYSRLDRDDIFRRLRKVTTGTAERRDMLKSLFEEAGCRDEKLTEQPVEGGEAPNLVCTLQGDTASRIIVGARFDAGSAKGGVIDNWTGAALLPSLYQSLYSRPRRHTIVFVALFSGGEKKHLGARSYTKSMSKGEAKDVAAMVELRGLGLTRTLSWQFGHDQILATLLNSVSESVMLPVDRIEPNKLGRVDASFFSKRNIPSLVIHSVSKYNHDILKGPDDSLDAVKLNEYYETYLVTASYLAFLDFALD